jgi:hypothetical protein
MLRPPPGDLVILPLLSFALAAPAAMPTHDLYADDGQVKDAGNALTFAVVGDTRDGSPIDRATGRVPAPGAETAIAADIGSAIDRDDIAFVAMLGNVVAGSSNGNWKAFAKDWHAVLKGTELSEGGTRVPVVPVAGVQDRGGDEWLAGWAAAFPGAGADIGYNRVASWYSFDVTVRGKVWRMLVLDSDHATLGSRWEEQLAWIPTACKGDYTGMLVFMNQPLVTLGLKQASNEGEGPKDLLAVVEDATRMGVMKAVFAANVGTNEVFLPTGKFGELYVNANSGAPASSQARWGHAEAAGIKDIQLEPIFDLSLLKEFDHWASAKELPETVLDRAKARGSYEGFVGEYDAKAFPIQGWWEVRILGEELAVTFRAMGPDNTFHDVYTVNYAKKEGWKIGG